MDAPADDHVWWFEIMGCDSDSNSCYLKWQLIHICALIPATFSIFASIYIIGTGIYYHQHVKTLRLSFGAKLPIFISICDLTFELCHGGDHLHNLLNGYVSEGYLCQLFGCLKPWSINAQTAWALGTAFYLISVLKNDKNEKFESNCVYLHILCWGIPTVILIFGFIYDVYGVEGPWCGISDPLTDLLMVDLWMIITYVLLFIGYSYTAYHLYKIMKGHFAKDARFSIGRSGVQRAIKTFGLFPIAYLIQWLAYALFKIHILPHTFGMIIWVVITGNLGGIFNLLLYYPLLMNQVKSFHSSNNNHSCNNTNNNKTSSKVYGSKNNVTKQLSAHISVMTSMQRKQFETEFELRRQSNASTLANNNDTNDTNEDTINDNNNDTAINRNERGISTTIGTIGTTPITPRTVTASLEYDQSNHSNHSHDQQSCEKPTNNNYKFINNNNNELDKNKNSNNTPVSPYIPFSISTNFATQDWEKMQISLNNQTRGNNGNNKNTNNNRNESGQECQESSKNSKRKIIRIDRDTSTDIVTHTNSLENESKTVNVSNSDDKYSSLRRDIAKLERLNSLRSNSTIASPTLTGEDNDTTDVDEPCNDNSNNNNNNCVRNDRNNILTESATDIEIQLTMQHQH